jgi:hypothetical protein
MLALLRGAGQGKMPIDPIVSTLETPGTPGHSGSESETGVDDTPSKPRLLKPTTTKTTAKATAMPKLKPKGGKS